MAANAIRLRISRVQTQWCRLKNPPAGPGEQYQPTRAEHLANIITHGLWIVPSAIATKLMMSYTSDPVELTTVLVYGSALVFLFSISTMFHILSYINRFPSWRRTFHVGDRCMIYVFIASSYTPWLLLKEFHSWAEETLCVVWIMAFLGIAYAYIFHEKYKWLEIIFYVATGLCPAACIVNMKDWAGLAELSVGGLCYIFGVIFFKADGRIPFAHAIWHCFVALGALFHLTAISTHLLDIQIPGCKLIHDLVFRKE